MSEEVEKVTTDKPKNAGRHEWGRKLGKMQKELKAKKQMDVPGNSYLKWEYGVAVAGIIIGVAALYYQKKKLRSR